MTEMWSGIQTASLINHLISGKSFDARVKAKNKHYEV